MSQRDTCCRHLRTCMPKFASLQFFETLWKELQSKNPMSTETSTLWHLSSHKLKRSCCASPSSAVETIKTTGRNLMLGPRLSTLSPTGPQLPTSHQQPLFAAVECIIQKKCVQVSIHENFIGAIRICKTKGNHNTVLFQTNMVLQNTNILRRIAHKTLQFLKGFQRESSDDFLLFQLVPQVLQLLLSSSSGIFSLLISFKA